MGDTNPQQERRIPVAEPALVGREREYVADCLETNWISSAGQYVNEFEAAFAEFCGVEHALSCANGTVALHLALLAEGIGPGDEVIVPTLTYVATANCVRYCGATPVFVDSERETWNLDPALLEEAITERTRGIVAVHLYGHPADMDPIMDIARRRRLWVIEDAAEAHGARYRGRIAGSIGTSAIFSFYGNKIITTGEGGMVVTDDDGFADELRLRRNLAFGKPRFLHEKPGYNFRMTGYQAAMGLAQLDRIDWFIEQKRRLAQTYNRLLADVPGVQTPPEKDWARNVYWMYAIALTDEFPISRDDLMARLRESGIDSRTFFCPMNMQPFLREQEGFRDVPCPVGERLWETGLYLPSSVTLTDEEIETVVDGIRAAVGAAA